MGSGKNAPNPQLPHPVPSRKNPAKKRDVTFLLNLLDSNVFQSHGLPKKRKYIWFLVFKSTGSHVYCTRY